VAGVCFWSAGLTFVAWLRQKIDRLTREVKCSSNNCTTESLGISLLYIYIRSTLDLVVSLCIDIEVELELVIGI